MLGEVFRRRPRPGGDDEIEAGVLERVQVARREHARVGDDHDITVPVTLPEPVQHGQQRRGLAPVALERMDLQREPHLIDQQADEDLRIDAPLLAHPDLAERVLVLRLEIQRGHVIHHHLQRPGRRHLPQRRVRELRSPVLLDATREGPPDRAQRRRLHTDLREHPDRVSLAGRLDDPRQHETLEAVGPDRVEPDLAVSVLENIQRTRAWEPTISGVAVTFCGASRSRSNASCPAWIFVRATSRRNSRSSGV